MNLQENLEFRLKILRLGQQLLETSGSPLPEGDGITCATVVSGNLKLVATQHGDTTSIGLIELDKRGKYKKHHYRLDTKPEHVIDINSLSELLGQPFVNAYYPIIDGSHHSNLSDSYTETTIEAGQALKIITTILNQAASA